MSNTFCLTVARELDADVCERHGAANAALPRVESDDGALQGRRRAGAVAYGVALGGVKGTGRGLRWKC